MRGLAKGVKQAPLVVRDVYTLEGFLCDCGAAGEPREAHAKDCPWVSVRKNLLRKLPKRKRRS